MKKFLLGTTAAVFLATPAISADMPVKAPPIAVAVYSWTGCYVGVAGGGAWGRSRHVSGDPATAGLNVTDNYNLSGGIVGIEYGCNWQTGRWVLGTESDLSWTNKRGDANNIAPFNLLAFSGTREHWLSTTRLRVGHLVSDRTLFYVTGGLAAARVEATIDATAVGLGAISETRTRWGWTAGAGVEFAVSGAWTMKADYLYVRLNDRRYFDPPPVGFSSRSNVPVDDHVFRVGLNYKFTDCVLLFTCGAVAARY